MFMAFIDADLSPWVGFLPGVFAKSSMAFFSVLHVIANKNIRQKIDFKLFQRINLKSAQNREVATIDAGVTYDVTSNS